MGTSVVEVIGSGRTELLKGNSDEVELARSVVEVSAAEEDGA